MTQRELIYIKTIAEEKSVSKAAAKLFVSQPSLSQCVRRIEVGLGARLFVRGAQGLTPTFAGEKYIATANNILKIYSDFENEVSSEANLITGRITIGLTFFLSAHILPKILPKFKKAHPGIEIFVVEKNSTELEKLLAAGEIDIAVMHTHKRIAIPNGIEENTLLFNDPFVAVVAKDSHILEKAVYSSCNPLPIIDIKDCQNEQFIMVHKGQRIRQITDYILQNEGLVPQIVLTTRNCETAKRLAAGGLGITLLPQYYTRIFGDSFEAQFCYLAHPDAYWTLSVMVQKNGYLSGAAKEFIKILQESYEV